MTIYNLKIFWLSCYLLLDSAKSKAFIELPRIVKIIIYYSLFIFYRPIAENFSTVFSKALLARLYPKLRTCFS